MGDKKETNEKLIKRYKKTLANFFVCDLVLFCFSFYKKTGEKPKCGKGGKRKKELSLSRFILYFFVVPASRRVYKSSISGKESNERIVN